jgi:hypothetical protein
VNRRLAEWIAREALGADAPNGAVRRHGGRGWQDD